MMWTAIKSYFACAWSAFTYIFQGMPADKQSYWANWLGFNDPTPELRAAWDAYRLAPGFHTLKNILVEWVKAWPQRAAKVMALGGCLFATVAWLIGFVIGWGFAWAA